MPKHNRHLPARPLVRLLQLTCALALLAAATVMVMPGPAHPPERVAAGASTTTTFGRTTDWHRELGEAVKRAQLAAFYEWASHQPPPTPPHERSTVHRPSTVNQAPAPLGDARQAIAAHFGDIYDAAVRVARCESGLDPGAISPGGGNWGLFQINTVHRADFEQFTGRSWSDAILDADANAAYARKLYDGNRGWGPWTCRWAA